MLHKSHNETPSCWHSTYFVCLRVGSDAGKATGLYLKMTCFRSAQ